MFRGGDRVPLSWMPRPSGRNSRLADQGRFLYDIL